MTSAVTSATLKMAQHNDKRFFVNVIDQDGVAMDISAASELTVIIAPSVTGTAAITKTLTGGGITLSGNTAYFFDISDTESGALTPGTLYHEHQIDTAGGDKVTILAGPFVLQDTLIED